MQGAGKRRSKGKADRREEGRGQQVISLASPDELPFAIRLGPLHSFSISKGNHPRAWTKVPLDARCSWQMHQQQHNNEVLSSLLTVVSIANSAKIDSA